MNTVQKGKRGENIAEKYLLQNNYKIITKNFYTRFGEIDIIAWDSEFNEFVFLEVKARTSSRFGSPVESISKSKFRKMVRTGRVYLDKYKIIGDYRFDCLGIEMDYNRRTAKIRHYKSIVL